MTTTYDAYLLGGYKGGTSLSFTATSEGKTSKTNTINASGNVLGGTVTTFSLSSNNPTGSVTYVGWVSYKSSGGPTLDGFIGHAANGSYYLFTAHITGTGNRPAAGTYTVTTDNTGSSSTWWDISGDSPGCFCAGTMIATPTGAVAVESLAAGDLVLTADGQVRRVRWLGRSTIARVFADPTQVLPIRIRAGALDENVPARDLLLSPGHAVRIGDVLVHAGALVNGTSIVRETDVPMVFTYYHLELDTHALLLAEGAPAESFLDGVEDMNFANWQDRVPAPEAMELPYPRARSARQLPGAVRAQLAARAAAIAAPVATAA